MQQISFVKISQPHIDQLHGNLELALRQLIALRVLGTAISDPHILIRLEECAYLVEQARQELPPKQTALLP